MRSVLVVLCLSVVLLLTLNPGVRIAAAEVNIDVGDYWQYEMTAAQYEGLDLNGTITLKVADTETVTVAGNNADVYNCTLTGSGSATGSLNDTEATLSITFSGNQIRLVSNFSIVSQLVVMSMVNASVLGNIYLNITFQGDFGPPFDDYIGDNNPTLHTTVTCSSQAIGVATSSLAIPPLFEGFPWFYSNYTYDFEENLTYEMVVVDTGVAVETKAGTFDCYKVNGTTTSGGSDSYETTYYSEDVGNYVKYEGTDVTGGLLSQGMVLVSYSHGGEASTGSLLILSAGLIAVVVVAAAILILLVLRKKGGPEPPPTPPPQ